MKPETLANVIRLISEVILVPASHINADTRLLEDLGVDGDDAVELLESFAARFKVDLAEFPFNRHFGPEAAWCPPYSLYLWLNGGSKLEAVTVGQLAEAAEKGAWKYGRP